MNIKARTTGFATAAFVLACASAPGLADDSASAVAYEDAVGCSALYTFLAAAVEDEPEEKVLDEFAIRWMVMAMRRDGTADGNRAVGELEGRVEIILNRVGEYGDNEAAIEQFITSSTAYCENKLEAAATEFANIDTGE